MLTIANPAEFREKFNRLSFGFQHQLSVDPLFDLPSLVSLCRRHEGKPGFLYCSIGRADISDGWKKGVTTQAISDALQTIDRCDGLVMIKHVEQDEVFGPRIRQLLSDIAELVGPSLKDDMLVGRGSILIASPGRVTAYHIDSDTNFLFQIHGEKTFSVFDSADPTLVTAVELEDFHAGNSDAAVFKADRQEDATVHDFLPGCALHIPSHAPHWARNGSQVSVALSLNYDLRSIETLGRIYVFNRRIRRFGLNPTSPGISPLKDSLKLQAAWIASLLRGTGKRSLTELPLGWRPPLDKGQADRPLL